MINVLHKYLIPCIVLHNMEKDFNVWMPLYHLKSVHTMPQLRCAALLHPPAQKLQCSHTAVSHESQIHFNLKCGEAAVTGGRK